MARKKSKEEIQFNMSQARNSNTSLENIICTKLMFEGVTTFVRNDKNVFGHPDLTFAAKKLLFFVTKIFGMDMIGTMRKKK